MFFANFRSQQRQSKIAENKVISWKSKFRRNMVDNIEINVEQ